MYGCLLVMNFCITWRHNRMDYEKFIAFSSIIPTQPIVQLHSVIPLLVWFKSLYINGFIGG